MCGFTGSFGKDLRPPSFDLSHRGPDDSSSYEKYDLKLDFYRLSIIGLDASPPPYEFGDTVVWGNAEIYNFKKLCAEFNLEDYGNDVAILPELIESIGLKRTLLSLRGMFALVVFNRKKRRLYLCADHFGIKPLWYRQVDHGLQFTSEIVKEEFSNNFTRISSELGLGACQKTFKRIAAGTFLEVDPSMHSVIHRYHEFDFLGSRKRRLSEEKLYDLLSQAIDRSLISDVPIVNMLSGGVDSSLIAMLSTKRISENIFFNYGGLKSNTEKENVTLLKETAEKLNEYQLDSTRDILDHLDSFKYPIVDFGFLAFDEMLEKVKMARGKVVLNGLGGDELFYGYHRMSRNPLKTILKSLYFRASIRDAYLNKGFVSPPKGIWWDIKSVVTYLIHYKKQNQEWEFQHYMQNLLIYSDYVSNRHSVELRCPLLDVDLWEYVLTLRIKDISAKKPLKKLLHDIGLNLSRKEGLGMPIEMLLHPDRIKHELIPRLIQILPEDYIDYYKKLFIQDSYSRVDKWRLLMLYSVFRR